MRRWIPLLALLLTHTGCGTETPTEAVVSNGYPASEALAVYRAWYATTLFGDPLAPESASAAQRTVPGSATAYAVLALGWDPSSKAKPTSFVPIQSKRELSVERGDTLRIVVSDRTFTGRCEGGEPLDQSDADFITQRIFPGDFAGVHYDASTCTATAVSDGGPAPLVDAASPTQEASVAMDAASR